MTTIAEVAELRRRILAGEELTADEYREVIAARRAARTELAATKTASKSTSAISTADALAALDKLF